MENIEFWNDFPIQDGVFIATPFLHSEFEINYLIVRTKESRIYADEIIKNLPEVPPSHPHFNEWRTRRIACDLILTYLSKNKSKKILDLGCGNGWFTNRIYLYTNALVIGVDINKTELTQAATLFSNDHCKFILCDVFKEVLPENYFDCIVLNASIQYFSSVPELLLLLIKHLRIGGEIHILNSPIYKNENKASQARQRSMDYFNLLNLHEKVNYYHHHTWQDFSNVTYQVMYDADSVKSIISRKVFKKGSPFSWIRIKNKI